MFKRGIVKRGSFCKYPTSQQTTKKFHLQRKNRFFIKNRNMMGELGETTKPIISSTIHDKSVNMDKNTYNDSKVF